ncbi:MAG: TRAM domain-containing protein, partial [Spirochaetia bacterium]|nr:TRAM domain-containing protein [Spirochaetia bacterium]
MVLTTEKLVQGGSALATTSEGKKVFIADALPNETLKVSITQDKGGYAFAKIDEILQR